MANDETSLEDVTAIIKTFERPQSLDRLIKSVRRFYPALKLIVADDSFRPYPRQDVEYLRLPPDVGVAAGRNAMLERVKTPYFLLLDDDWIFTEETRIERLAAVVRQHDVTLAAGDMIHCHRRFFVIVKRRPQPFHGVLRFDGDHLTLTPGSRGQEHGYLLCDIVNNFYVARTEHIRALGGWDPELKTNEHIEFFVRFTKRGLRAAFCPDTSILNWVTKPFRYKAFRRRRHNHIGLAKHGIQKMTGFTGQTFVFNPAA